LASKKLKKKKKVLFVDIGASFGTYTIALGRAFRSYKNFSIIAFEPDIAVFSHTGFSLLKKNIDINNIRNVKLYKIALSSKNRKTDGGVQYQKLDNLFSRKFIQSFDEVVIKIYIDGAEMEALSGAKDFIKNCQNIQLMIEDVVNRDIVS